MYSNNKGGGYDPIFNKTVRAGKRKYFFDVKEGSRGRYLIITESKRAQDGYIEKHKIMCFPEDAEELMEAFSESIKELIVGRDESGLDYAPGGKGYEDRQKEQSEENSEATPTTPQSSPAEAPAPASQDENAVDSNDVDVKIEL